MRGARSRIKQLKRLGVSQIVFQGHTKLGRLGVLGLGTVGVVVCAIAEGRTIALKIRRTDANRSSMKEEARVASLANRVGVGPEVYAHTKDLMLMQFLEFQQLDEWLRALKGPGRRDEARRVVHSLLNQCRKLDIMGMDHGQLSNLRKHAVIAQGEPWIIDFESAATTRRPKNVTAAAQYLLVGGGLSPFMRRTLGLRDPNLVLRLLKSYKADPSDYNYAKMLEELKLV